MTRTGAKELCSIFFDELLDQLDKLHYAKYESLESIDYAIEEHVAEIARRLVLSNEDNSWK